MAFIQHTTNWVNGEILEATIMGVAGGAIMLSGFLFWKYASTPNAKALVIPMLVVGAIPLINGIVSVANNKSRLTVYEQAWQEDKHAFVVAEKARVRSFDDIFKYSYPFAFFMVIGGAGLFFLLKSPTGRAISLAMMTLGLMAYYIDHFAKERADMYMEHIEAYLLKK